MENKLIIIDGNSILYREFFALPNLTSPQGEPSGAIYGFARHIIDVFTKIKPSHIAVAFDAGRHTFRNDMFDGYKATRKPMPDALRSQLDPIKNMLDEMGIKHVEIPGIEGDDVIGSIARKFDTKVIIVTGDRDSYQLVNERTVVYLNKKGLTDVNVLDEKAIKETFGVTPTMMIDVKALQGDSSDNIPGVKGVGEKTALSLIQKYGSLDGVYSNIDKITGSTKTKLIEGKDDAYLSLRLAKIKTDAEIDLKLEDLKVNFPFNDNVRKIFTYYGFKSLSSKPELFSATGEGLYSEAVTKPSKKENCIEEDIDVLLNDFKNLGEISILENGEHLYFSLCNKIFKILNNDENINKLKTLFESENVLKIIFDSKKLRNRLSNCNILLTGEVFDVMIAKHLVSGKSIVKIEDLYESEDITPEDIVGSFGAMKIELEENLVKMNMFALYKDVEMPLSVVLFEMEKEGFKIDVKRLKEQEEKYEKEINELKKEIFETCGEEFNINSPKQLGEIIYDKLKLARSTKKSTASEKLEKLALKHPLIPLVIRYRKIAKFLSSFIKNMYEHIDKNGFIHTTFNQTLTTTGRLSSSEPNLQNIPIRGDESREIRSMFVARSEDNVLIDADYSQIELRIMAHVTKDDLLLKAFKNGEDIHTQTAMKIFDVSRDEVTPNMRRTAKVVNFGVNYGISEYGLATDLNISSYEAKQYIDSFFMHHPNIKLFMEQSVKSARETGRVTTLLGRTRKIDEINDANYMVRSRAERAAYNMPIQGSASDIIKIAMINVQKELKNRNLKAKLIMQVHDELIVDSPKVEAGIVNEILVNEMKNALVLDVPLDVDSTTAYRWSDGH